jgi:lipopolysaccharide transport system ATP-binding protein
LTRRKFDEIVEFADIGDYIDTPVKRYSSGMQVRLGFAVAAHLESEILIVDEVLAVGDAAFQRRCLGKLEDMAHGGGRTVLFVSHNLQAVHGLCDRAVYLERGRLVELADAPTVVRTYLERNAAVSPEKTWIVAERPGDETFNLVALRVMSPDGELLTSTNSESPIVVELEIDFAGDASVAVGFDLETEDGNVVLSSFLPQDGDPATTLAAGRNLLRAVIPGGLLNTGRFTIGPRASRAGAGQIFHVAASIQFEVISRHDDALFGLRRQGAVAPALAWRCLQD